MSQRKKKVQTIKRPKFTNEQLAYLREIFKPLCCHVTGTHDPTHWYRNKNQFCSLQTNKAWEKGLKAIGIKFHEAISDPDCWWCHGEYRKKYYYGGKKKLVEVK